MDILVFTANFGGYDQLVPSRWGGLCFCDGGLEPVEGWRYQTIYSGKDPHWASRIVKIPAHRHHDAEFSIYIDGNIELLVDPREIVQEFLLDTGANYATFAHPERECVYREADACVRLRKGSADRIAAQMEEYRTRGFPPDFGLSACWVLVRRHTEAVQAFDETWWGEVERHKSRRDQLSFDVVRWQTGLHVERLPGNLFADTSPHFKRRAHERVGTNQYHWRTAYGKQITTDERTCLVAAAQAAANRAALEGRQAVIVNIGIFRGCTMLCLEAGAPNATLVGIDIKAPDVPLAPQLGRAEVIIADSTQLWRKWGLREDKWIDLLFVDGDHRYAGVRDDLAGWSRFIRPGGSLLLHDYSPLPRHLALLPWLEGVRRATDEWQRRAQWERFVGPDSLVAFRRPK
jgi:hypothetical protein